MRKHLAYILAVIMIITCFSGCAPVGSKTEGLPQGAAEREILTMVPVDQSKTMITVRYESGVPYIELEALIEDAFPNVDIVMVHGGSNSGAYSLRKNLENGIENDLIFSVHLPAIQSIAEKYLFDFSSEEFVGNYFMSALDACADSKQRLYYLPGPSDVYGVVYDRTMFGENGWEVPESYSEFMNLIQTINDANLTAKWTEDGKAREERVKAVQLSLKFPDAFQILFNTFAYEQVYRGADNQQWLMDYQNGKGSMVGHMEPAVDALLRLAEAGVVSADDFTVRPWERSQKLYKYHTTAMIFENQNAYTSNLGFQSDESGLHEMGIFPFWISDGPDSDYLFSIPSFYMSVNQAACNESVEKKKILLDIIDFLSQADTQEQLLNGDTQVSNVQGVPVTTSDFSKDIKKTIEDGRIITTFAFTGDDSTKAVEWAMRDSAADLLEGRISVREWLLIADKARDDYLNGGTLPEVYGTAERTLTRLETAQLVGDMYRQVTKAPIALVFVGSDNDGVTGTLYKGDITEDTLLGFSPSRRAETNPAGIAVGSLTGRQIIEILSGQKAKNYTAASGLIVEFAPWNEPGSRLVSCTLPDGTQLDPDEEYKVAYYTGSLRDYDGKHITVPDEIVLDGTWEEHFISWVKEQGGTVKAPELTTKLIWKRK